MTAELAVVSLLSLLGLGVAAHLARKAAGAAASSAEARHVVAAAERAADGFFLREVRAAAAPLACAVFVALCAHATLLTVGATPANWVSFTGTIAGVVIGAMVTLAASYAAARTGLASAATTLRATHVSLDHATATGLRGAGTTALLTDALGLAALAGPCALVYLLGGGAQAGAPEDASTLVLEATRVLPGVAAGVTTTAVILAGGGASYRMAALSAAKVPPFLEPCSPQSPAMVAEMVAEHVGTGVRRTVEMLASTTLATAGLVAAGTALVGKEAPQALGPRGWALITLPLVARGVAIVATAFGLVAVRQREAEHPTRALWRGQAATAGLAAGGLGGASMWLLGPEYSKVVVLSAGLGLAAMALSSHLGRRQTDRRFRSLQETLALERSGAPLLATRGIAVGLGAAFLPVTAFVGSALVSVELGGASSLTHGAFVAGTAFLVGALSSSGFTLAVGLLAPIAYAAGRLATFEVDAGRSDVRRRIALLEDSALDAGDVTDAGFIILGGCAALLAAAGLQTWSSSAGWTLPLAALLGSGALGGSLVTLLTGLALSASIRSAAGATQEVERQLKGLARSGGTVVVPPDFTPSYRTVVDVTGRLAIQGIIGPSIAAVLAPVVLGIGLRLLYKSAVPAAEGVAAFVVFAAAAGFGVAFAGAGVRAVLGAAHRASRPRPPSSGLEVAHAGHSLGEFLGSVASPLIHLVVQTVAVTALLTAPALARL